jgi:hypothetical protein
VNETIRNIDPKHYEDSKALRAAIEKEYPFTRALGAVDNLIYEGHEILLNVHSGEHYDKQDPKRAWVWATTGGVIWSFQNLGFGFG